MYVHASRRQGLSRVEVLLIAGLGTITILILMMLLPRQRETARGAGCQENLRRIGVGLMLYAQDRDGQIPDTPELSPLDRAATPGPLARLLGGLGYLDLSLLRDPEHAPPRKPGPIPTERVVGGFLCPSDPEASSRRFPAPVSYRANAGDAPDGRNGPFAPGVRNKLAGVEAADGLEYTAAFSERLIGDGRAPAAASLRNYAVSADPLSSGGSCDTAGSSWRSDAGRSWVEASWRSSLYNHALPPFAPTSCIATDGQTALISPSSGHGGTVNVLTLAGGVRPYTKQVDPKIWKALGTINDRPPGPKPTASPVGGSGPPP